MSLACQPEGQPDGPRQDLPEAQPTAQAGAQRDGSTSLKWGDDGELSPVDLQRVLARLSEAALTRCELDPPRTAAADANAGRDPIG